MSGNEWMRVANAVVDAVEEVEQLLRARLAGLALAAHSHIALLQLSLPPITHMPGDQCRLAMAVDPPAAAME